MAQPSTYEQYLLELINAERAKVGAQPLAFDGDLNEASEGHSQWMIGTTRSRIQAPADRTRVRA